MSAIATDGTLLDIDSLPQRLHYDGSSNVDYVEVSLGAVTYRQTFTRDGSGNITDVSQWVKQ